LRRSALKRVEIERARQRQRKAARRKHIPHQKSAGQAEGGRKLGQ
jgi:hypothetical protein